VIVADTGVVVALIDSDDRHHSAVAALFSSGPTEWVLPWAILPEVDYLLSAHVGQRAEEAFLAALASASLLVEWGSEADLTDAHRICRRHKALRLGLVDAVVIAIAERLRPEAIATLDLRHFAAVSIKGNPKLFPRDLPQS
jgi:predicted nucleic acid-binding protein